MKRLLIAGLLSLSVGCESAKNAVVKAGGWDVPSPVYGEAKEVQPPDIPAPSGFKLQTSGKESYYLIVDRYRDAQLVYSGDAILDDVVMFYRSQMPLPINGWKEDGLEKTSKGVLLRFVKGDKGEYRCSVEVSRPYDQSPLRVDVRLKTYL